MGWLTQLSQTRRWRTTADPPSPLDPDPYNTRDLSSLPFPMVLSYSPGKVGGTAIVQAMRQAGLEAHQVHTLRPAQLMARAQASMAAGHLPQRHISLAMALRPDIVGARRDIRIVTGVRDPVDRSLSSFFENLHRRTDGLNKDSPPEALFEAWSAAVYPHSPIDWLEHELKGQLGIDILAKPFDREARLAHLPDHKTLVLRIDCEQPAREAALMALVGRAIRMGEANVGATKAYATAYQAVRQMARLPRVLVDAVYDTAYCRHFWTDAERLAMARRWRDGVG